MSHSGHNKAQGCRTTTGITPKLYYIVGHRVPRRPGGAATRTPIDERNRQTIEASLGCRLVLGTCTRPPDCLHGAYTCNFAFTAAFLLAAVGGLLVANILGRTPVLAVVLATAGSSGAGKGC